MEEPSAVTRLATRQDARPRVPRDPSASRVRHRSPMRDCGGLRMRPHAHRHVSPSRLRRRESRYRRMGSLRAEGRPSGAAVGHEDVPGCLLPDKGRSSCACAGWQWVETCQQWMRAHEVGGALHTASGVQLQTALAVGVTTQRATPETSVRLVVRVRQRVRSR